MEMVLTTLAAWSGAISTWLQTSTGMTVKDLALFAGGILMVIAVLLLGIYSGKPRYREAARFSWFILFMSVAVIAWGLYNPNVRG
jgi:hypothetical protein